jgi:hypothetical protein
MADLDHPLDESVVLLRQSDLDRMTCRLAGVRAQLDALASERDLLSKKIAAATFLLEHLDP